MTEYLTSAFICEQTGAAHQVACKWAAANGVRYIGEGRRKTYQWTEDDLNRFKDRLSPGWVKGRPRKPRD